MSVESGNIPAATVITQDLDNNIQQARCPNLNLGLVASCWAYLKGWYRFTLWLRNVDRFTEHPPGSQIKIKSKIRRRIGGRARFAPINSADRYDH